MKMQHEITSGVLHEIIATLDIPESAYDKVEKRYLDLGKWLERPESRCAKFAPHVYPQGSFRLGTVNRPLHASGEYDLDLGCRLRQGVTKASHSQQELKALVGRDLEDYRTARQLESGLEEKHRCWRLPYQDELAFHMDAVPSIPQEMPQIQTLTEGMVKAGSTRALAERVARLAGAITDNRQPQYAEISPNWPISNSEGYAIWFESRMKLAMPLLERRAVQAKMARVDDLPARKWKSPLQQAVQILKRHRDVMFADNPEGEPISIIITTLSALAYQGEQDIAGALERILMDMGNYVRSVKPRVPNPVNPVEDFADKWSDPEYQHLNLATNFKLWLEQARVDFSKLNTSRDPDFLSGQIRESFALTISTQTLKEKFGPETPNVVTEPKRHNIVVPAARPWMRW